jgi:hypothetical protein
MAAGFGAMIGLAFDLAQILAMMDPERTRVEVPAVSGETYIHYCKPGPEGETPRQQAEAAQVVLEENLMKFAEVLLEGMVADVDAGRSDLAMGLSVMRKSDSWVGAINKHLDDAYGCTWTGTS